MTRDGWWARGVSSFEELVDRLLYGDDDDAESEVVMVPCEGGCGVLLTAELREVEDDVTTVHRHTPERCRMIRTLRVAGQAAVGPDGVCEVLDALVPPAFVVAVSRRAADDVTVELRLFLAEDYAWSFSPDRLGVLGAEVEGLIRRALENPTQAAPMWSGGHMPVLARDPFGGRM